MITRKCVSRTGYRTATGGLLAAFAVLLTLLLPASPAAALSCVGYPDDVERVVLSGADLEPGGYRFFDRFGLAVVGTVTGISPADGLRLPWSDRSGQEPAQAVAVDVLAGFGRSDVPAQLTVANPDPGMFGYQFEVGRTYFIPLKNVDGEWRSFACDPIADVAPGQVPELKQLAAASGIQVAANSPQATGSAQVPRTAPARSGVVSGPLLAGLAGAVLLLVAAGAWTLCRRVSQAAKSA